MTTGGGAIFADFGAGSQVFLKNSTISDNGSANLGGGVRLRGDMTAEIKYSTIANNYAYESGGGVYNSLTSCTISNSILAGNENQTGLSRICAAPRTVACPTPCWPGPSTPTTATTAATSWIPIPLLEPLSNNGGNAGWTHALQSGARRSMLAMQVPPRQTTISAGRDSRGWWCGVLDMGAYEFAPQEDGIFSDRFEQP